jgi:DNA-binding transcriptional ArsR family regulator
MPDAARFELTATQEWRRSWRRRLAPVAWVVLEELCEEADGDGEAHVSARSLAAVLDLDKDTVARALRVLTAAGVVAVGGQVREGGRFGRGSYRVVAGRWPIGVPTRTRARSHDGRRLRSRRPAGAGAGGGRRASADSSRSSTTTSTPAHNKIRPNPPSPTPASSDAPLPRTSSLPPSTTTTDKCPPAAAPVSLRR